MEEIIQYTEQLKDALEAKTKFLDVNTLKQMKEDFQVFQSAYRTIYNVLLKKGLIHEDPYKVELKISDVKTPSEAPFAESEKLEQLSIRLSQYESYVDFLNNYYQFSVEFLTMNRIKKIISLVKYFNFLTFSVTNQSANTKYFAEMVEVVKKGGDQLSNGIISESLLQLEKLSKKIFLALKELAVVHKEHYKLRIRETYLNPMNMTSDYAFPNQEAIKKQIKQKLAESASDATFYPDLISEIFKEDYGSDGESLREDILKLLEVKDRDFDKKNKAVTYKPVLLEGIRIVTGCKFSLDDAMKKLLENQAFLENQDKTFFSKLKKALKEMFGQKSEHVIHEIEYLDQARGVHVKESLDFTNFSQEMSKKVQNLMIMGTKTSTNYKRLEASDENAIFNYLKKGIEDLQYAHKRLFALDDFYAITLSKMEYRSIKIELGLIKNAIIKANQKKHEYVAAQEEIEQLKRLGIKDV